MTELLESGGVRFAAYAITAIAAFSAGWAETRSHSRDRSTHWPAFWFVMGSALIALGVARATGIFNTVGDFGKRQAGAMGWYELRRPFQAVAVLIVCGIWTAVVIAALRSAPERRNRYVPAALALFSIAAFAAVRFVSLHHVDWLLDRRDIGGIRLGALGELTLLAVAVVTTRWFPFSSGRDRRPSDTVRTGRFE